MVLFRFYFLFPTFKEIVFYISFFPSIFLEFMHSIKEKTFLVATFSFLTCVLG